MNFETAHVVGCQARSGSVVDVLSYDPLSTYPSLVGSATGSFGLPLIGNPVTRLFYSGIPMRMSIVEEVRG